MKLRDHQIDPAVVAKGSVSSGTVTFDQKDGRDQSITVAGAQTWVFSNLTAKGVAIHATNPGAYTITFSDTINWLKGDGTKSTTFSSMGVTLQSSGVNTIIVWSPDGGTTKYGKAA